MLAGKSFMDCFRCLSAYNGLAALAIVPYFFTGAFADVYRYNVLLGPECAMQEVSDGGIGLEQVTLIALISTMTQAVTAFTAPLLVGTSKFLFQEHDYPMAFGNFCGCLSTILVLASGGNDAILAAIAFAVNSSVGVAAVLCWYEGPLQKWTVAALTSRSVWTNIGNFITAPFVYSASFGSLSNGMPCAAFTFAIYATGSICLLVAHWLNLRQVRMHRDKETAGLMTPDDLRVSSIRMQMTTGF